MQPLLSSVLGQPVAVDTLRRALVSGRVHHAYLFDGPDGVGKELTAFGLAQALVCERRVAPQVRPSAQARQPGQSEQAGAGGACGECRACARAVPRAGAATPLHPDVVVIERGIYDPAAIGRRTPETQDISIDQVRTLVLARAAFAPHEGRAKVFIVRRAEELSLSAANALLKTLEEPGPRTHFVLLSSTADALMPTILSRTQRVRFGALPDAVVTSLLGQRGIDGARAAEVARLAGGSMSAALILGDPEASARREEFVARALMALDARDPGLALELAEDAKKSEKAGLVVHILALATALGVRARAAAGDSGRGADADVGRYAMALAALQDLDGNAAAQLAVEAMLLKMRSA